MSDENTILSAPAIFWDGVKQLNGKLYLSSTSINFIFDDFRHSHLDLMIPIGEVEKVELFLLFDIARKGLKVRSKNGRESLFVMDDPRLFYEKLKN